jgi:PAS domain S-box-containing protein
MGAQPRERSEASGSVMQPSPAGRDSAAPLIRIAALLDALHCGAFLVDRGGRIAHVNRRLCAMMQRGCDELVGRTLFELYPDGPGRAAVQHALDHFDESREQEFYLPLADGTELPIIVSGRRLEGESPLGDHRVVTVIDIASQKRVERELQQRYREIAALTDTVLEQALDLKRYSHRLEERVHERTLELHEANMEAIYMLAIASEAKDFDTGAHVRRIQHYTCLLARELGLSAKEAERMGYSAILHDVGKIQVPDDILRKPAPLSEPEWQVIRQHPLAGERILSRTPFFDVARSIARGHHENWDGSGYPDGLRGQKTPLAARIVRVADVFDALTTRRTYKPAWSAAEAAETIVRDRERFFDPDVVDSFERLFRDGRLAPGNGDVCERERGPRR